MQRVAFVSAFAVAMSAGVARADIVVPEPKRDACSGKKDNDACELEGKPGTCKKQTCSRKVGGVLNPSVVDEDCVLCDLTPTKAETATPTQIDPVKPSPATPEPATPEPATPEPAKSEPAKAEPATSEPAKREPATSEPEKAEPEKAELAKAEPAKSSGCRVSTETIPRLGFAFGLGLLALVRPRRR